jgi:Sigma-70, region 4
MRPDEIVTVLIETESPLCARRLIEATVHLPTRSRRWVATFRDGTGRQVWRATGSRNRRNALALAKQWEREAKLKSAAQGAPLRKPTIRVRHGSGERELGLMSQAEVAAVLRISERAVREIERRAFDKLRRHPGLRGFWREHTTGKIAEAFSQAEKWALSQAEITAVYALARTPVEQRALQKLLAVVG